MNAMNMPVKVLLKSEVARTEACGWVLVGCGLLLDAVMLVGNLTEGRGVLAALQAGIVPVLFGAWMLDRARLMAQVAAVAKPSTLAA